VAEVNDALANLKEWAAPEKVPTPAALAPGSSFIQREPLGVVLNIVPFNYPVQLALMPLIAAVAAGNCVVIKPSEVAAHSAVLLGRMLPRYVDTDCIKVVQGGVPETTALLDQRWDHIFYTGNGAVAAIVMRAAAKYLTPVTLELGGKSPVVVDRTADLALAAKRIIIGKFFNCAQTCVAPDYVLVESSVEKPLMEQLKATITEFYGPDPKTSSDLGRIISRRHFDRLANLLATAGGTVEAGGVTDADELYIAPTLIRGPAPDAAVMQEEIFGPLLPVIQVPHVDDAIKFINARPKPLAMYIFSSSSSAQSKLLGATSAGGVCINDTIMHYVNTALPFGGVGASGMGAYHGKFGFDTFSHKKGVFNQATLIDTGKFRYPPYSDGKLRILTGFLAGLPHMPKVPVKDLALVGMAVAIVLLSLRITNKL
jgi:aldehyde dehydrogenase (NAD+)